MTDQVRDKWFEESGEYPDPPPRFMFMGPRHFKLYTSNPNEYIKRLTYPFGNE